MIVVFETGGVRVRCPGAGQEDVVTRPGGRLAYDSGSMNVSCAARAALVSRVAGTNAPGRAVSGTGRQGGGR
ncbi:hypothetical protein GCM10008939_21660 [Deinococcus aquiradiocola]|uniref:Uncharacterized protein n=1 Tax=Deinococcus aquiradiocola TaxID=393059 RepID=A0A917UQI0_9DEIO|nr:hypothetical protein GCM10008939_21660 [Deinococcus aquiradiocola]